MADPYDPAVDAAERGLLSASCLSPSQLAQMRSRRPHSFAMSIAPDRLPPARSVSELAADQSMRAFWSDAHHGLPIDLVEPDAPAPKGDRVPCHLFMSEVAWPAVLPPILRAPRRELYLQSVEPWGPSWSEVNDLSDAVWRRMLRVFGIGALLAVVVAAGVLR